VDCGDRAFLLATTRAATPTADASVSNQPPVGCERRVGGRFIAHLLPLLS
jgi:hypothetical protein